MNKLRTEKICKVINKTNILDDINLTLESGTIYGLIGKNGSGKTMLLRLLSGLIKPSSGHLFYNGDEMTDLMNTKYKIGVVIENASLYLEFTGLKNLAYLAKINNYIGESEVTEAMIRVGLDPDDKRTVKKYSLGMKQRLAVAQAIMEKPDYLFLDEPTNALDKDGVSLIRKIILEESKRGAIVLIASHNDEDIKELCGKIFYMAEGKLTEGEIL